MRLAPAALLVVSLASVQPEAGFAQAAAARLAGKVLNVAESPVSGVELTLLGLSQTTSSDSAGRFEFRAVPPGDYVVRIRRIGFRAQQLWVHLEPRQTKEVLIVLEPGAYELPALEVKAQSLKPVEYAYTHRYDDFFRYRNLGWGLFKTRQQFENLRPNTVADIVRGMSRVRVIDRMFERPEVEIRGCRRLGVWIDGSLQHPVRFSSHDLLERIHPSQVEMVAVFRGPAEMPAEAAMFVHNDCAIMIWTK